MGILSDFIVADPTDAGAIDAATDRARWPTYQSKGFTQLEVAYLHFLLAGADPHAPTSPPKVVVNPFTKREATVSVLVAYLDEFTCLLQTEGSWVHRLPEALVAEIATATNLASIAEAWAGCEELHGAEPKSLRDVLIELQRLARLAKAEKKSLLLWTSL